MTDTFRLLVLLFLLSVPDAAFGGEADSLALFRRWSRSSSPDLRIQAAKALRGQAGAEARAALFSMLKDPHTAVRGAVRAELVLRPPAEGPDLAREAAALRNAGARLEALRAVLERCEDPSLFYEDRVPDVRARALALGRPPTALLRRTLRDRDARCRALALELLADPEEAGALARDPAEQPRIAVARVTHDPPVLAGLLTDPSWRVRLAAVRASERLRSVATLPILIERLDREEGRLRWRTARALENLTRLPFGDNVARWRKWWAKTGDGFGLPEPRARVGPRPQHTSSRISFRRLPVVSRRLSFVLDASRSMEKPAPGAKGKSRWDLVVRDLCAVLDRLPSSARFNVILFRTEPEAWKRNLTAATRGARRSCRKWVEGVKPSGWTNLYDAVALALEDDQVDTLYVLTDGVPSRGSETRRRGILAELALLNRYRLVQINCVQAGSSEGLGKSWRGFLEELATAHEGWSVRE